MPERKRHVAHVNYKPWILGAGAIAALMFLMVFFMSGNHHETASHVSPATPATSGSAAPVVPGAR